MCSWERYKCYNDFNVSAAAHGDSTLAFECLHPKVHLSLQRGHAKQLTITNKCSKSNNSLRPMVVLWQLCPLSFCRQRWPSPHKPWSEWGVEGDSWRIGLRGSALCRSPPKTVITHYNKHWHITICTNTLQYAANNTIYTNTLQYALTHYYLHFAVNNTIYTNTLQYALIHYHLH